MVEFVDTQLASVFSDPTWDIVALLFFWATGFFYGVSLGVRKMLALLFALYLSILLFLVFPYKNYPYFQNVFAQISVFGLFFIFSAFVFTKTVFRGGKKTRKSLSSARWWHVFILSFLQANIVIVTLFNLFSIHNYWGLSWIGQTIFLKTSMFFWWLVLSMPILFIIIKKPKLTKQGNRP